MKVLAEETIVRCHIEFDEKETILLKSVGFLPPYVDPRARLWLTTAEIERCSALLAAPKVER